MLVLCQCIIMSNESKIETKWRDSNTLMISMGCAMKKESICDIPCQPWLYERFWPFRVYEFCANLENSDAARRLHGDFVAGVSNLIYFFPKHKQGVLIYSPWPADPSHRPADSRRRPAVQTCGFPLPVTSHVVTRGRRFSKQEV